MLEEEKGCTKRSLHTVENSTAERDLRPFLGVEVEAREFLASQMLVTIVGITRSSRHLPFLTSKLECYMSCEHG